MTTATVAEAYVACAEITREQARNFHYGIRLLPPSKRDALCAIYALARRIDDIGDGDLPQSVKVEQLAAVRASLARLDDSDDAVLLALSDATRHFPIPLHAFDELLDGVEMDVVGARFATFDELVHYCRCVAGSIGRLCLSVFGASDLIVAPAYADALGVALQQTNILRDIREDYLNGRVYLPQEDLDRFGVVIGVDEAGALVDDGALSALVRFSAARARTWYDDGLRLVPLLDRRSAACCTAMSGIYQRLLDRIESNPALIRDRRLSLSGWQKTRVAVSSLMGSSR
ncbi:MAG TPA: presqualene diphosphate synthase HpnD [Mycobacteriales bacterium]|nr:presqualene diphosphate synthase HpnD [Mycobacteriales bacterium]